MGKKQADALYERLIQQENQRLDRLASCKQKIRESEAENCTFHPQIRVKSSHKGRVSAELRGRDSELISDPQSRYRGMPTRRASKSSFSSTNIFRRSEEFLIQKQERTLEKRRQALEEKERKEMQNCSFYPKIHSDAYLQTKKIHLSSRANSRPCQTTETSPLAANSKFESQNLKQIDSGEYLELEFYEEQEKCLNRFSLSNRKNLDASKSCKVSQTILQRSATPKRRTSIAKSSVKEFKTPNPKSSKSQQNWRPIKFEESKKKPHSPAIPFRKSKESFFKRSIVVLNENDEFEDLEIYLAKIKSNQLVSKKPKIEAGRLANSYADMIARNSEYDEHVELSMEETSEGQIVSSTYHTKLIKSKNIKQKIATLQGGEGSGLGSSYDKENQSRMQNLVTVQLNIDVSSTDKA